MRRVEYRIERIPLNRAEPHQLQLVERLAQLGRQGWHVASAELTPRPDHEREPLTVLLERDVDEGHRPRRDGSSGTRNTEPPSS
jgi:hypothetical protein